MGTSTEGTLQNTFRRLAELYEWRLAADHDAFLREAAAQFLEVADSGDEARRAELAVKRAYGARLVAGVRARDNQAAAEIWRAMWHAARRNGWDADAADEIAQDAVTIIIAKIDGGELRSPHALLTWQFWILRDVLKRKRSRREQGDGISADADAVTQLSDASDLAADVEIRMVAGPLFALLDRMIPEPGRTILLRTVVLDERPREIAQALGMTEPRVRVQKCRALKRLRESDEAIQLLRALVESGEVGGEGSPSDE